MIDSIAGLTVHVELPASGDVSSDGSSGDGRECDVLFRLHAGKAPARTFGETLWDIPGKASLRSSDDAMVLALEEDVAAKFVWPWGQQRTPRLTALIRRDMKDFDLYIGQRECLDEESVWVSVQNVLFCTLSALLCSRNGMLLHASCVDDRGGALIFFGPSNVGKSTMARIWTGQHDARVVGDENLGIRKMGQIFRAYPIPWRCQGTPSVLDESALSLMDGVPVRAAFLLEHANKNSINALHDTEAAASILANSFTFHTMWNAERASSFLELVCELVAVVPVYRLGFVPDESVVAFLRNQDFAKELIPTPDSLNSEIWK